MCTYYSGLRPRISISTPPNLFPNLATVELVVLCICIVQHSVIVTSATELSPCNLAAGPAEQLITRDCLFSGAPAAVNSFIRGTLGRADGPPALVYRINNGSIQPRSTRGPASSVTITYAILDGFKLPDPNSPAGLMPNGLLAGSIGTAALRDVRILVDNATLQQHVTYFAGLPAVRVYTDNSSFLHVNWHASSSASWQSVGLLLATNLQEARDTNIPSSDSIYNTSSATVTASSALTAAGLQAQQAQPPSKYSYALAANSTTLAPLLHQLGAVQGPRPALIYLDSNVTLSKPPFPQAGVVIGRPLAIVGLVSANTSLDFHMTVNTLMLTAPQANLTLDSVVVENQGPGDARSAEIARPASVSSAGNFWALYYPRTERRLTVANSTIVVSSQEELDYYLYWATVFHSELPYFREMARFVRDTIQASEWVLIDPGQGNSSVLVVRATSSAASLQDTLCTVNEVVAPRLPLPPVPPSLQLQQAQKSPLVRAVSSAPAFLEQLQPLGPSEAGRANVILLRTEIFLSVMDTVTNSSSSSSSSKTTTTNSSSSQGNHSTVTSNETAPIEPFPVPYPTTLLGDLLTVGQGPDRDNSPAVLDLGWRRELLALPAGASPGHLQIQHLVLQGLSQGPGAADAKGLEAPDIWTILLWFVKRESRMSVGVSACVLELPAQEFAQLQSMAAQGSGQVLLRLARNVRGGSDGLLILDGVQTITNSSGFSSLHVASMAGHGLNGTNLTLVPSAAAAAAPPGGYFWPGGDAPGWMDSLTAAQQSEAAFRVKVALGVSISVVMAVAVAVAAVVLLWRRRERQRQQLQDDVEKSRRGALSDGLLPHIRRSSESSGAAGGAGQADSVVSGVVGSFCSKDVAAAAASHVNASAAALHLNNLSAASNDVVHLTKQPAAQRHVHIHEDDHVLRVQGAEDAFQQQQQQVAHGQQQQRVADGQLQLRQQGLDLLRARPHGTLVLQDSSNASYQAWFAAIQEDEADEPWGNHQAADDKLKAAEEHLPKPLQVDSIMVPPGCVLSTTHVPEGDSSARRHSQHDGAEQVDGTDCSAVTAAATDSSATAAQQQQQHQAAGNAAAAGAAGASPAAAALGLNLVPGGLAAPSARLPTSSSCGSAQHAPSTSWKRVSGAISLLQHDITLRRLQAGMQDISNAASTGSGSRVAAAATVVGCTPNKLVLDIAAAQHNNSAELTAAETAGGACNQSATNSSQHSSHQQVQLFEMIGRGTFASVYRALWRGRCVAVKVVHLPGDVGCGGGEGGSVAAAVQTRERMAVMEAVVSVTMSHPNIVQVFTFGLKPLSTSLPDMSNLTTPEQQQLQQLLRQQQGSHLPAKATGWELQLVMEYCEEGSLRQALNQGRLTDPASSTGLPALHMVLALAHDVACAMLHLHSEGLIHADLKASNVLLTKGTSPITAGCSSSGGSSNNCLKQGINASAIGVEATAGGRTAEALAAAAAAGASSTGADQLSSGNSSSSKMSCAALLELQQANNGSRLIAKVADFGLSLSLNPGDTHVSHMHAGTLTHMAPELLLHGRASAASDVYAFGILLWELLTGRRAFLGVPVALLGHNVVHLRWRPQWPPGVAAVVKMLVEQCWAQEASARPSFSDILVRLEQLLQLSPAQLHDSSYPVEPGGALQHHNEPPAALPQAEEQRDRAKHARNDLLPPTQQQRQQQDRLKSSTSAQGGELYQGYL